MFLSKKMDAKDFVGYLVAQFLGAIVGAALLGILAGWDCGFGANGLYNDSIWLSCWLRSSSPACSCSPSWASPLRRKTAAFPACDRPDPDAGAHLRHPLHRHLRQPRPLLRPRPVCRGRRPGERVVFILAPLVGGALAACLWKLVSADK
jgi:aquaporin Z